MQITLKPADFASTSIMAFPNHVSNGHWMIHKDRLANAHVFATPEIIRAFAPNLAKNHNVPIRVNEDNGQADRILAGIPTDGTATAWTVQPWIHVDTTTIGRGRTQRTIMHEAYVLTSPDFATCYISREYADRFGLTPGTVLHGEATGVGALATADRTFVVMPIRRDKNAHAPFRSIVHMEDTTPATPAKRGKAA